MMGRDDLRGKNDLPGNEIGNLEATVCVIARDEKSSG